MKLNKLIYIKEFDLTGYWFVSKNDDTKLLYLSESQLKGIFKKYKYLSGLFEDCLALDTEDSVYQVIHNIITDFKNTIKYFYIETGIRYQNIVELKFDKGFAHFSNLPYVFNKEVKHHTVGGDFYTNSSVEYNHRPYIYTVNNYFDFNGFHNDYLTDQQLVTFLESV